MVSGWFIKFFCLAGLVAGSLFASKPTAEELRTYAPFLLPADHPIKPTLDAIFSEARATLNLETLQEAGFAKSYPRKFTKLVVTKHPAMPGYIFKLFLDAQRYPKNVPEYQSMFRRIQGASLLRRLIAEHGLEDHFKVPQKWLYRLPKTHMPAQGYETKYYILVEEDMQILSDKENKAYWASEAVPYEYLDEVYFLVEEGGFADCLKPDNIPFSQDGRIAFIDTETFGAKKINRRRLERYLSKSRQEYWKALTREDARSPKSE